MKKVLAAKVGLILAMQSARNSEAVELVCHKVEVDELPECTPYLPSCAGEKRGKKGKLKKDWQR